MTGDEAQHLELWNCIPNSTMLASTDPSALSSFARL